MEFNENHTKQFREKTLPFQCFLSFYKYSFIQKYMNTITHSIKCIDFHRNHYKQFL